LNFESVENVRSSNVVRFELELLHISMCRYWSVDSRTKAGDVFGWNPTWRWPDGAGWCRGSSFTSTVCQPQDEESRQIRLHPASGCIDDMF